MTVKTATPDKHKITNYLNTQKKSDTIRDLLQGLLADQKYINSKYFYDAKGSKLFEMITQLEEYYPTRTEKSLIRKAGTELSRKFTRQRIIELGSGDHSKIALFLEAFSTKQLQSVCYTPVDVSTNAIEESTLSLTQQFPELTIDGKVADFTSQLDLIPNNESNLWCFFGSTLGNFTRKQRADFLLHLSNKMNNGDLLLLGLDNVKDKNILELAYNDRKGITAAFNKNILLHVNHQLGTQFNPNDFAHEAFFNIHKSRIEMHLKALKNMEVNVPLLPKPISISADETIHTENSYKFSHEQIKEIVLTYGFSLKQFYTDQQDWFSLLLLEKR